MESIIQKYLFINENLQWIGKPDDKRVFQTNDFYFIPLGFSFFFFALLWEANEIVNLIVVDRSGSFIVCAMRIVLGLLGIVVGIYLSVLRIIFRKRKRQRTLFAITDKRILIIHGDSNKVQERNINHDLNINKAIDGNGFGTLMFYPISTFHKMLKETQMDSSWFYNNEEIPEFNDLHDADKVYDIITNIKANNG